MFKPNSFNPNLYQVVIQQVFYCGLTIKPEGMFKSRIVCSVFPLKVIMGGSICPSVADENSQMFFFSLPEERTTQSLSHIFKILFDGTMSSNTDVSSMLRTRKSGYFPVLMKCAASSQNLLRTPSSCFGSSWSIKVWARVASLCRLKNFLTQSLLALKDGL